MGDGEAGRGHGEGFVGGRRETREVTAGMNAGGDDPFGREVMS